jgi:hypothetical protein
VPWYTRKNATNRSVRANSRRAVGTIGSSDERKSFGAVSVPGVAATRMFESESGADEKAGTVT